MAINALIFDFDGLILDTETPVFEAWRDCYAAHGQTLALEEYVGCVGSDFGRFSPASQLESLHQETINWSFWDQWRSERVWRLVMQKKALPGIFNLLEEARMEGFPCAVASSSPRRWVEPLLQKLEIRDFFKAVRCLDHVARPKPDPSLFLAAADALNVPSAEALVLEDSLNGLLAAKAAGSPCVAVPNAITRHLDFQGAAARLESLEGVSLQQLRELGSAPVPTAS